MKKDKKVSLLFKVTPEQREQLKCMAFDRDRSVAYILRVMIDNEWNLTQKQKCGANKVIHS